MQSTHTVSPSFSPFQTERKLTESDGVHILGSVLTYLQSVDIVRNLSDLHPNIAAQNTILGLRRQLWRKTYGRSL